jgi:glycosyltransferase involved in cell wall biosynthesis
MNKLSVAIATFNEEKNIRDCLDSVKDIADEIVVIDGSSTDNTAKIATEMGAKVTITDNPSIFHINKQKAIDNSTYDWILQLDADERVTKKLSDEIKKVINLNQEEVKEHQQNLKKRELFLRHKRLLEQRDGKVGEDEGDYVAFFIPRLNYFLGKYLKYGGVYPDGVIRLFIKNKAYLPCKSVHEQYIVKGRVGWLGNDLLHYDSPSFKRYIQRNNRYIDLMAEDMRKNNLGKNPFEIVNYFVIKPLFWFINTQLRHKGILDGYQGIVFSFFSAMRFPRAYLRYLKSN